MKKILVTGAAGMAGTELFKLLDGKENVIIGTDLKWGQDLRDYKLCNALCNEVDEIYHVAGVRGNPAYTKSNPLDFLLPMLQIDSNIIRAAIENEVTKFLYTSSIGVFYNTDKYSSYAKKVGETIVEAAKIQYPNMKFCVVRPSNIYGRYDDFKNEKNSMVITSLIRKAITGPHIDLLTDGKETRDFINAKDVVRGMILTMKEMPPEPINLCYGAQVSIESVAKLIGSLTNKVVTYKNVSSENKSKELPLNGYLVGFEPEIHLNDGIKEAIEYARKQL